MERRGVTIVDTFAEAMLDVARNGLPPDSGRGGRGRGA